jgi:formylmethanofuran:tetrahydromethanopterin formyltransferase
MTKKVLFAAVVCALVAAPGFAGCEKPSAPNDFPDGKSAAMDDMMAAKKAVDSFRKDMEEYLSCEKNTGKLESAQAELGRVAARFNAEVRAFKAKG